MATLGAITMQKKLPVTLISGFLGSGKTTLLQHILKSKDHNLKCAVIVNDMASINIDGMLLEQAELIQREEQMVKMQNGCICCTLRKDLLEEINRLAMNGTFDYLVIESTGISEPMQVAETFTTEFGCHVEEQKHDEEKGNKEEEVTLEALQSLAESARLDTCVSMVDASTFFEYYNSSRFASDTFEDVKEKDERTVVDLMVDQIEFADIIILNKLDTCSGEKANKICEILYGLNKKAKIVGTTYSAVDLKEIMNTGLFSMEKAMTSAGWLQSLKEDMVPESEEYGISSFVYRQRRPFHPQRIFELLKTGFVIMEKVQGTANASGQENMSVKGTEELDVEQDTKKENDKVLFTTEEGKARLDNKQKSVFEHLLRSKGIMWIKGRDRFMAGWSQAGIILTVTAGHRWFVEMPLDMFNAQSDDVKKYITKDFVDGIGDRRQEIVFIGDFKNEEEKDELRNALDSCLMGIEENLEDDLEDPWDDWK
jgi:G3E family GTPase